MPKTVSFIIENKTFQGELTYGDKNEIKCTLLKPHSIMPLKIKTTFLKI